MKTNECKLPLLTSMRDYNSNRISPIEATNHLSSLVENASKDIRYIHEANFITEQQGECYIPCSLTDTELDYAAEDNFAKSTKIIENSSIDQIRLIIERYLNQIDSLEETVELLENKIKKSESNIEKLEETFKNIKECLKS